MRRIDRRERAEKRGRRGETIAAWWLRLHGWRIVAKRVRTRAGEIDLIARRWRTLAFIEVKTRDSAVARDVAIDDWRLRRVIRAAEALVPRYAGPHDTIRIDVILLARGKLPLHIANVSHG